jgi:Raf kinase inhibitor-like YbhB/YbcL family protein
MKIWSDSFRDGGSIPAEFAFAMTDPDTRVRLAGNRNPHLTWSDVPAGAESLALLCIDGDAPQDGRDVNQPDRTLAVEMPRGDFFHWSLIDIPLGHSAIAAGAMSSGVTVRGKAGPDIVLGRDGTATHLRQGINDYTNWFSGDPAMAGDYYGYDGPCPPWNDLRLHHYIFRMYALDLPRLELPGRFSGPDVCAAIHGHIIDEAQLIGTYTLNPSLASAQR